jgi:hypothetical protein
MILFVNFLNIGLKELTSKQLTTSSRVLVVKYVVTVMVLYETLMFISQLSSLLHKMAATCVYFVQLARGYPDLYLEGFWMESWLGYRVS